MRGRDLALLSFLPTPAERRFVQLKFENRLSRNELEAWIASEVSESLGINHGQAFKSVQDKFNAWRDVHVHMKTDLWSTVAMSEDEVIRSTDGQKIYIEQLIRWSKMTNETSLNEVISTEYNESVRQGERQRQWARAAESGNVFEECVQVKRMSCGHVQMDPNPLYHKNDGAYIVKTVVCGACPPVDGTQITFSADTYQLMDDTAKAWRRSPQSLEWADSTRCPRQKTRCH